MKTKWIVILLVVLAVLFGITVMAVVIALASGASLGGNQIALIHLTGTIAGSGTGVIPETIISELRRADNNPAVKAILLRIDSPGGTAAASQEIATEVERIKKPVVVSIADVGASGAYMVSAAADEILALPASEVGSIGVIIELPDIERLAERYGVGVTVIKQGKLKDMGNPFRKLTPEEESILKADSKLTYDQFIQQVAKGRKLPVEKVRSLATGRVWVGTEAKDLGLVDRLGTVQDAVDRAAVLGKIKGKPNVVDYDQPEFGGLLNLLLNGSYGVDPAAALKPFGLDPVQGRSPVKY